MSGEMGLKFSNLAPRMDAWIIILCFEDGDTETVRGTEIMGAVEMYGDMYVQKVTPFFNARIGRRGVPETVCGCEMQLSNQAEAGRI